MLRGKGARRASCCPPEHAFALSRLAAWAHCCQAHLRRLSACVTVALERNVGRILEETFCGAPKSAGVTLLLSSRRLL